LIAHGVSGKVLMKAHAMWWEVSFSDKPELAAQ
jgi:hypothetical protein